jgi:nucleolar protein 4
VQKLHAHVFKGALLSAALKRRLDALAAKPVLARPTGAPAFSGPGATGAAPSRASRLIVRNLPWDITAEDLRALFLPYGPLHSVHMPLAAAPDTSADVSATRGAGDEVEAEDAVDDDDGDDDGSGKAANGPATASKVATTVQPARTRGFAFVWFLSRPDAERALAGANGTRVRAGIAARLAADKQKRKKEVRLEAKRAAGETKDEEGAEGERVIAVDWALSKDRWEEAKRGIEAADAEAKGAEGSASSSGEEDEDEDEDEDGALGVHSNSDAADSDADSDAESDVDADEGEAPVKPQLPAPEVGTTLFVRNVPYDATEDELRTL